MQATLDAAREARQAGDVRTAEALLRQAVAGDPALEAAQLELIDVLIDAGATDEASALLQPLGPWAGNEDRVKALQARLALASDGPVDDVATLQARIAAEPDNLDARLALGKRLAAQGAWADSLETLLEIVRRDRSYGEDIGRRTMLDVFNLMPPGHPEIRIWRARLAQLINR